MQRDTNRKRSQNISICKWPDLIFKRPPKCTLNTTLKTKTLLDLLNTLGKIGGYKVSIEILKTYQYKTG
jgi:hypothetical protein